MKKLLVIAHNYMFNSSASGIIERSLFEYLQNNDFEVTVVCSDHDSMRSEFSQCAIYKAHDNQLARYFIAFLKYFVAQDFAFLPDYKRLSWYHSAFKTADKILKDNRYDYIHSIGIPHTDHLVALKLKQKYDIPWIAQFFDPWYGNPYRSFKCNFLRKIDFRMEESVAKNADIILHNSYPAADDWIGRYGVLVNRKIRVLPLTFNPEKLVITREEKKHNNLTISHVGNFYKNRSSECFIDAVHLLVSRNPDIKKKLRIIYVGTVTENERSLIREYGLNTVFDIKGVLSNEACLSIYNESDVFLSIDRPDGNSYFFPSKIMKYFYYRRPILGITPKGSVLDYELSMSGNYSFRNNDVNGIASFIESAIYNYDALLHSIDVDYWTKYTVQNVASEYMKLLK